jgi:hypothetical protein
MIRVVHEFFCAHGRCREVKLADGAHYPVTLSIIQLPAVAEIPHGGAARAPGLRITYRGHEEDLTALRCISRDMLAAARHGPSQDGALLRVERKAAPGRRRMIELSYIVHFRAMAAVLPGVRLYCADWLEELPGQPPLRLAVDNTRRQPEDAPPEPSTRIQRAASE